jgi:hypothetical protein
VNAYVQRLLKVDDLDFRHESVIYFFVAWMDSNASSIINARGLDSNAPIPTTCRKVCNTMTSDARCCDDIYVPSFFFVNAYGFPQDRQVGYKIQPLGDGLMGMVAVVHGIYASVSAHTLRLRLVHLRTCTLGLLHS